MPHDSHIAHKRRHLAVCQAVEKCGFSELRPGALGARPDPGRANVGTCASARSAVASDPSPPLVNDNALEARVSNTPNGVYSQKLHLHAYRTRLSGRNRIGAWSDVRVKPQSVSEAVATLS